MRRGIGFQRRAAFAGLILDVGNIISTFDEYTMSLYL
jgi:hypothetical protein